MRFQATLEGDKCLRRSDAGWQSVSSAATKNAWSPIVVWHKDGVTIADVDPCHCALW